MNYINIYFIHKHFQQQFLIGVMNFLNDFGSRILLSINEFCCGCKALKWQLVNTFIIKILTHL